MKMLSVLIEKKKHLNPWMRGEEEEELFWPLSCI